MAYPPGAGPYGAAFGGDPYIAPSSALADPSTAGTGVGDTRPRILNATAQSAADGTSVATFTAPATVAWLVRRIVVQSDTQGKALVYVGGLDPANVVSGTYSGEFDENDANQPYLVPEGQTLSVVWQAGGTAQARIEYDEV